MTMGALVTAFLPAAAAMSPDTTPVATLPMAIAQPLLPVPSSHARTPFLPEAGQILLIGSALLAVGAMVRRATKE